MSLKPLSIHDLLKLHLPSAGAITLFQPIMAGNQATGNETIETRRPVSTQSMNMEQNARTALNSLLAMLGVEGSEKLLARLGSMVTDAAGAMEAVMGQLEIQPDEQQAALAELLTVMERRFRQIVTALLIEALLPGLQRRAVRHFRRKRRESEDVALDLSQTMVANILGALNGRQPNGNAGAWVAKIRHNVYADHVRKRERGRQVLSNIEKAARSMRR